MTAPSPEGRRMTIRQHRNRDGSPKRLFPDERQATEFLSGFPAEDREVMNVYECARCGQWHLGHRREAWDDTDS